MAPDVSLRIDGIRKSYQTARDRVDVLRGVSFEIEDGGALAITGPSGSGKSTLLQILGTLDRPSTGSLRINGQDPFVLSEPELALFRNSTLGFVFQDHHLLPQYSVLENVLMPTFAHPPRKEGALVRAKDLIEQVGLSHRIEHRPAELSGGERQRVAVARALINQPTLVLCDEPTGSLDQETANSVGDLLSDLQGPGTLLVVVTHSVDLAGRFERRLELRGGLCSEL